MDPSENHLSHLVIQCRGVKIIQDIKNNNSYKFY